MNKLYEPHKLTEEELNQLREEYTTNHHYLLEHKAPDDVLMLFAHIDALELELQQAKQ